MPFPWKEVQSARISRLVNDHLHSGQKRRDGSSLVVETGFPTSLVDLFMKNRGKLKKSSKKRRHSPTVSDAAGPVIAGSPASFPSPPAPLSLPIEESVIPPVRSPLDCPSPPRSSPPPLPSRDPDDSIVVRSSDGDAVGSVGAKRVSFVFVKFFLVVLIALGTKRLTVGITISAFLLLFLEYVGKHARGFFKPISDSNGVLKLMLQRVCLLLRFMEVKLDEYDGVLLTPELQQEHSLEPDFSSMKSLESGCRNQEIQVVEASYYRVNHVEEIQLENEVMVGSCLEGRFRYQEIESEEASMEKEESKHEVRELKTAKSRRAKMKLKLKKFFLKKPRSSRKEHEPQRLENVEEIVVCDEQETNQCPDEGESESACDSSSISMDICASGGSAEVNEVRGTKSQENEETFKSGFSLRYMVLCMIVLVGLVGGRGIAILLALSWYMLLKLFETLPRYMEVPTIRSFADKSG